MPQEIPLPLSIGHRVYAHISSPENGVFLGTIAAVDTVEHTYRVVFDRNTIGSQTVADYNIKSLNACQIVPIKAYVQTYRPKSTQITPHKFLQTPTNTMYLLDELSNTGLTTPQTSNLIIQSHLSSNLLNDPMLGVSSPLKLLDDPLHHYMTANSATTDPNSNGLLGGFPIRLLVSITRLNKILNVKKEYIKKLSDLNTEAEYIKVNKNYYSREFQLKYASLIIDIEKLNKDLSDYLVGVQRYCEEYAPDFKIFFKNLGSNNSENIYKKSLIEAREMVTRLNKTAATAPTSSSSCIVRTPGVIDLIKKLTSIMLQIRDYANATPIGTINETLMDNMSTTDDTATGTTNTNDLNEKTSQPQASIFDTNTYVDTKSINLTIDDIKSKLSSTNRKLFEDKVQVHVNHIQTALNYYSKLHAFKETDDSLIELINNRSAATVTSNTSDIIKSMINDDNSNSSSSSCSSSSTSY